MSISLTNCGHPGASGAATCLGNCTLHPRKPAEPKEEPKQVQAPDVLAECWVIYRKRAAGLSIDVAETAEMADALCNRQLGDYAVRYVKAGGQ